MSLQSLATIATIIGGVIALGGLAIGLVRYARPRVRVWFQRRREGLTLELIPVHFELFLGKPLPTVTLTLRAVNYLRTPVLLQAVRIRFLHVGTSPGVDEITSPDEYVIPARQSREVSCRRRLIESEAAALRALSSKQRWWEGSIMCSARGSTGKREVRYEPAGEFTIYGTVDGPTPTAA